MPRSAVALARFALPIAAPTTDAQLLSAFVSARAEDHFAELVRRHGPMVFTVCRRVLSDTHDAEDAFQATFLVLARKAGSVRGSNVSGWLYGVAVRTARGVRIMRDRHQKRLRRSLTSGAKNQAPAPDTALADTEQAAIIDEELAKLPELYREAVVLCELRGLSRREAAASLGVPEGTVSSRLASAKRKLAKRLGARGLAPALALAALALGSASVSAELVQATAVAVRGAAGGVASAAANAVLKAMLFDQLKTGALVGAVCLAFVCGGLALTGSAEVPPAGKSAPARIAADDPVAKIVKQLGSADFAEREAAEKELRAIGPKAEAALKIGLRSGDPEVRARCATILAGVRRAALADLAKNFDPKIEAQPEHPLWKRFKSIAGNTPAAREVFARVIANKKWLNTLDRAENDPAKAGHIYRVGFAEVFRDFDKDPAKSPPWPCYRGDEVAYLLFLGSHPDPTPPEKLTGDEVFPPSLRNTTFLGRGITHSEAQITHGRGLPLGLTGQWLDTSKEGTPAIDGPPGTDRVFAKLFAAWLVQRPASSDVVPPAFRQVSYHRLADLLPLARQYAANDFKPKREVPPLVTAAALEAVAQLGTRADLPLFERHFADKTDLTPEQATRSFQPLPPPNTTQLRDLALGLALLLHGRDPEQFGFTVKEETFKKKGDRYEITWYSHASLGFASDEARAAAFKKATAFFADQPKPEPQKEAPKPNPAHAKLVEQLGSANRADREAASDAIRAVGLKAEPALKGALKSNDPDVRLRATNLLDAIRRDAREALAKGFDPQKGAEPDHPVWERFKTVVGGDRAARILFAELIADPRRLGTLDAAARDPDAARDLYLGELKAYYTSVEALWEKQKNKPNAPGLPAPAERPWADEVVVLYLGTYARTAGAGPETNLENHVFRSWGEALKSPAAAAVRRVFVAWFALRENENALAGGFQRIGRDGISEALPLLRRLATDTKSDPERRAQAALLIGKLGAPGDLPLLRRVAGSEEAVKPHTTWRVVTKGRQELNFLWNTERLGGKVTPEQRAEVMKNVEWAVGDRSLADCAWAAAVKLGGGRPMELGFLHPHALDGGTTDAEWFEVLSLHGFPDTKSRATAHTKAKEWLDMRKK